MTLFDDKDPSIKEAIKLLKDPSIWERTFVYRRPRGAPPEVEGEEEKSYRATVSAKPEVETALRTILSHPLSTGECIIEGGPNLLVINITQEARNRVIREFLRIEQKPHNPDDGLEDRPRDGGYQGESWDR